MTIITFSYLSEAKTSNQFQTEASEALHSLFGSQFKIVGGMLPAKAEPEPQQLKWPIKYRTGIVYLEKDIKVYAQQITNGQIIIPTIPYCKRRFLC